LSGGKDEKVIRWGPDFGSPKDTIKLPRNFGSSSPIRAVAESKEGKIIVGTATSEIYEIGTDKKPKLLIQGHADGELWGLSAHPSKNTFATAADDKTVRVWDIAQHQLIGMEQLSNSARSVDFSPDGKRLAVGAMNGSVLTNCVQSNIYIVHYTRGWHNERSAKEEKQKGSYP
jgi:microtubule-associated protein-like 6